MWRSLDVAVVRGDLSLGWTSFRGNERHSYFPTERNLWLTKIHFSGGVRGVVVLASVLRERPSSHSAEAFSFLPPLQLQEGSGCVLPSPYASACWGVSGWAETAHGARAAQVAQLLLPQSYLLVPPQASSCAWLIWTAVSMSVAASSAVRFRNNDLEQQVSVVLWGEPRSMCYRRLLGSDFKCPSMHLHGCGGTSGSPRGRAAFSKSLASKMKK